MSKDFNQRILFGKTLQIIALVWLLIILTGCGEGGETTVEVTNATNNSVTLIWEAPTTNADDSALTDLGGYKIYYGTSSGNYTQEVNVGNVNTYTLTLADGATYYFTVTAYDTLGNESEYSNEVNKTI